MRLEIVTHCWRYSRALIYQLSSVYLFPPQQLDLVVTVFACHDDIRTVETLEYFRSLSWPGNVQLRPWWLPEDRLKRRMIGRNMAALTTEAEWIWFTDCDYLFRNKCFDSLASVSGKITGPLAYPRRVRGNMTHLDGDVLLQNASGSPRILDIDTSVFRTVVMTRAIGGIQITRGDAARKFGYCRRSTWHKKPAGAWIRNYADQWFRKQLGTDGQAVPIPNVYRIRHSERGSSLLDGLPDPLNV